MFRTVPLSIIRRFHSTHSNGICHADFLKACEQAANMYGIYYFCVYSEKLLMMDRGTVRNM